MKIKVNDTVAYAYTGAKQYDPDAETVMFVHGASLDHTVWTLPARHFARRGLNVLAVDLPGHGLSQGKPCPTISQYADWLIAFLDSADIKAPTALVGHSMGSLVTLDCASRYPERTRAMVLVGTAVPMQVTEDLLNATQNNVQSAIDILTAWGHSPGAHLGGNETPGMWMIGGTSRLFQRGATGVLFNDLNACNNYGSGLEAAGKVRCPSLLILGQHDMLTPVRAARQLADAIADSKTVVLPKTGHTIMSEKPDTLLDHLIGIV